MTTMAGRAVCRLKTGATAAMATVSGASESALRHWSQDGVGGWGPCSGGLHALLDFCDSRHSPRATGEMRSAQAAGASSPGV